VEKAEKAREKRLAMILRKKVERRFTAFPWLQDVVPMPAKSATMDELYETDDLQKLELDLQGAPTRLFGYLQRGSAILENVWGDGSKMTFVPEAFRLNLVGVSKIINHEMFLRDAGPLIQETVIEYPAFGAMSLPFRWLECIAATLLLVHQSNTNPIVKDMLAKKGVPEEELKQKMAEAEEEINKKKK
jgi:hypothetical protein